MGQAAADRGSGRRSVGAVALSASGPIRRTRRAQTPQVVWAALALLAPATALANVIFGLAFQIGAELLIVLYPVILLEAYVLSKLLSVPFKRAHSLAAGANLVSAVVASSLVGLVVDSMVFLWLAFGSLQFLLGQIVGKAWMVLFSIPLVLLLRRRDLRIGIASK